MSSNEWKLIKRILLLCLFAALFPLGAFAYRFLFDTQLLVSAAPTIFPGLYTLVPGAEQPAPLPSPTPTAMVLVVPNGWQELSVTEQNFAIAVPPRWQQLPVNPQELTSSLQAINRSNPELAAALGNRGPELFSSGVKLWAFDFNPDSLKSNFATNLTITRQLVSNPVSFDTYVTVNISQVQQLPSLKGDVTHERIALGSLAAERLRYDLSFHSADGSENTSAITQYLVLSGPNAYVITFATLYDLADRYASDFDMSAGTFRILQP